MSKHKKALAARRKQHNKSAKARHAVWAAEQQSRRERWLEEKARREAEAANVKSAPPKSRQIIEDELDALLMGSSSNIPWMRFLSTAGISNIERLKQLVPEVDIEAAYPRTPKEAEEAITCKPGMQLPRKNFKVGDPKAQHTDQCMARHMARCTEASRVEADLLAKGEEALACYLYPTFMICTCDEPEDEDGSTQA